ncbi:MAG TPA: hypothetical protein VFB32_03395 [Rudaea sp.]|nr:hypothetical protein [Rudaea sp.]
MPASAQRYYLSIDDLARARGSIAELSFHGSSPDGFAAQLQAALREPALWERWRAMQPDPDAVDPGLGASDPIASVIAKQTDLHCDAEVVTRLPHAVLKHRLCLLIGSHWRLRDVRAV